MCTRKEMSFSVFILHHLAKSWDTTPEKVYKILNDTHIIDDYIIACYDTLHTQGEKCLVEDITEMVKEKGVVL
ncbi:MAG: DUF3791 domain-containing protein [Anaerostipes sp.]|jgi:chloramphenicol O-acetyltransferase